MHFELASLLSEVVESQLARLHFLPWRAANGRRGRGVASAANGWRVASGQLIIFCLEELALTHHGKSRGWVRRAHTGLEAKWL